jgi:mannose-1-phosphate guanylyltransferase
MPALHEGLAEIERAIDTPDYDAAVERAYDNLHSVSIDYGVMEKTSKPIYVLKADFGWSDVGSWQALYELRRAECDEQGNLSLGDSTIIEAKRNLIFSTTGRNVALLGVEDLVIVDTPDAVMVARLDSSQDVKRFADQRRER